MRKKTILFLLSAILFLSILLRFWQLGSIPISPDWDEVALGYNAYSILQTGKDEYGKFLPVVFRSFDDYKPGLYVYLIVPLIPILDLTVFSVRFPAAFFGVIGVLATFFLVKELFKNNKYTDHLALLSSFLLAISPWDIQFSRVGFESHVAAVFNLLMALFFLKSFKKPILIIPASVFAVLGIYMYQSEKVFVPLFLLILLAVYFKDFIKIPKKYLAISVILGLIITLPMAHYIFSNKESLLRVKGTSVFADQTQVLKNSIPRLQRDEKNKDMIGMVFDNRRIVYGQAIIAGYLSHFDLNWLFVSGDLSRHHAPGMGLLYLWEFPFLFLGIYFLIFADFSKKTKLFIFLWLLITPIPASITSGVPHAVRTMNFLPTWQILIAVGILSAYLKISEIKYQIVKIKLKYLIPFIYMLFIIFNILYYLNQYFVQQNYYTAKDWQYGWDEAVKYVKTVEMDYQKIIVSDSMPLDRSYMFFAFYLKYSPLQYQKFGINSSGGFAEAHKFGKYEFRPLNYKIDSQNKNVLLIGLPSEFPSSSAENGGLTPLKIINYPDGKPAIEIVGK